MNWYDDLCEYYNVTLQQALELGTRKTGRRPFFPQSVTCENPPQGLTFEEIWDAKPRDTIQQKMDFYKDLGPWQCFRQSVFRANYDYSVYFKYFQNIKDSFTILEYGCGISHLINFIVDRATNIPQEFKFILVDVAGEHLEFAKWRLKKKAPNNSFEFHEITEKYPVPKFGTNIDFTLITEVLEHLPNSYDVIKNITDFSNEGSVLVENYIDKTADWGHADLEEAAIQRPQVLDFLDNHYDTVELKDGHTRIRKLK